MEIAVAKDIMLFQVSLNSDNYSHINSHIEEEDGGCSYEDNSLYINYQRKTFRRDKINKETLNKQRNTKRDEAYCKFIYSYTLARRHNNEIFSRFEDRFIPKHREEPKHILLDKVRKTEYNDRKEHKREKSEAKKHKHEKIEVKEHKHKKREAKDQKKISSKDFLDFDDEYLQNSVNQQEEYSTKMHLSKLTK